MQNSKLFQLTRRKLALLYAGIMGLIMSGFGVAIYQVMATVHWSALDQELEVVSGTIHDALEPNLKQPRQITAEVKELLPGLCVTGTVCDSFAADQERHILGAVQHSGYYLRFLTPDGELIASSGDQVHQLVIETNSSWQTLTDRQGIRYHQMSLLLKNQDGLPWGYMQIGRSLQEYDAHLISLKWFLAIGLPLSLILITLTGWWLAGYAMQPVYRSYNQIQQFTADAAHELRTPLAAVRATVESSLQLPDVPEEVQSALQTVERQNNRLSQLVQDLLLLTRMDIQAAKPKQQVCCLNDLVSDIIEELAALALKADVVLDWQKDAQILHILGDEEQIYRLLINLITNAIQYTPEQGKVTVKLERDEHQAVLQVRDTGIGISEADQSRIFDRFYRVNSDRSRATGGSGLGLSIAQAIVQAHQGTIQVQSSPGQGSLFIVRFPFVKKNPI
jgi:signal transduction histidine kinase